MDEPESTLEGQSIPDGPTIDALIVSSMPTFLAVNYQRLLEAEIPEKQLTLALHIYELGLRTLTINLMYQYLNRDQDTLSESPLNDFIINRFATLTLDACQELLFLLLRAYEGRRAALFVPELYDFYWDDTRLPHQRRIEREAPFRRLTQIDALWKKSTLARSKPRASAPPLDLPALAYESKALLQQIFAHLGFVANYDLIRVLAVEDRSYTFERNKGLAPAQDSATLPPHLAIEPEKFYLRSVAGDLLVLHPLVIFSRSATQDSSALLGDTGLYQQSAYDELQFLLALAGKILIGSEHFADFEAQIYKRLQEKLHRITVEQLTWLQLTEICGKITKVRIATVANKYDRAVYLQRADARTEFERFLDSDKRCFILIGKSGVGKSNFLLSLLDEFEHARQSSCLLLYDGGQLRDPISQTVEADFNTYWKRQGAEPGSIWQELAENEHLRGRQLVLGVDAVNESQRASELLRELDELAQQPWPWLKIVLSCRPETWHAIKRGIKLSSKLYYQKQHSEQVEVELEQLSYSEQITEFDRFELQEAYEKYMVRYDLKTAFAELPPALKELLREPLQLFLVANSYRKKVIPASLKLGELVATYIDALITSERLRMDDLDFLEDQLAPLMLREGKYTNELSAATLRRSGELLYDQIYNETLLPSGQRFNQAYLNFCDVEILSSEGGWNQKIKFKYERFYEYFIGRLIFRMSKAQTDRLTFYKKLIQDIEQTPYLWGAVKQALIREVQGHHAEAIVRLCFTDDQRTKDLLVSALVELGRDDQGRVERILERLLARPRPPGLWQRMKQLRQQATKSESRARTASTIAVEVASTLGIPWVLQAAGMHPDSTLRAVTVRESYNLWARDRAAGFAVLEYLAREATPGRIPNMRAFETVFGLTMIIFFQHYAEPEVSGQLQEIWRGIVGQVLRIQEHGSRIGNAVRGWIRQLVLSVGFDAVFAILRYHPQWPVDVDMFESSFRFSAQEKTIYRNLTRWMDLDYQGSPAELRQNMLAVFQLNSFLAEAVLMLVILVQCIKDLVGVTNLLPELFEKAKISPYPLQWSTALFNGITCSLFPTPELLAQLGLQRPSQERPRIDQAFLSHEPAYQIFVERMDEFQSFHSPEKRNARYLAPYIEQLYLRTGSGLDSWLRGQIALAFKARDQAFIRFLLESEICVTAIDMRVPRPMFEVLGLLYQHLTTENLPHQDAAAIGAMLIRTLARLRIYYPELVEDFLEDQRTTGDFRLQVRTSDPVETIPELIGVRIIWFVRDHVLLGDPELRARLIDVFTKSVELKDLKRWVNYFMREVINTVYGGEALRQKTK